MSNKLARRPTHGSAAQKMKVQVMHRLPRLRAAVYDQAVSPSGDALLKGQIIGHLEHATQKERILSFDLG